VAQWACPASTVAVSLPRNPRCRRKANRAIRRALISFSSVFRVQPSPAIRLSVYFLMPACIMHTDCLVRIDASCQVPYTRYIQYPQHMPYLCTPNCVVSPSDLPNFIVTSNLVPQGLVPTIFFMQLCQGDGPHSGPHGSSACSICYQAHGPSYGGPPITVRGGGSWTRSWFVPLLRTRTISR